MRMQRSEQVDVGTIAELFKLGIDIHRDLPQVLKYIFRHLASNEKVDPYCTEKSLPAPMP